MTKRRDSVLDQADVIVVGGGIVGMATAHALKRRGFDVIVVEQRFLAFGASGRSAGGVWVQTRRAGVELDLARRSTLMYQEYQQELGATFEFEQRGGVFYFENESQERILQRYVDDRLANGVDVRFIDAAEARELAPSIPPTALGGVFCPEDAYVGTAKAVRALGDRARRTGVRLYENTAMLGLLRHGDDVTGVRTIRGDIRAEGVVWAGGAWVPNLAAEGVELPVVPARIGLVQTQPLPERSSTITHGPRGVAWASALTSLESFDPDVFNSELAGAAGLSYDDTVTQTAEGNLVTGHTIDFADSLNPHITVGATRVMLNILADRRPDLASLGVTGLWAGLVGVTADRLPIIDNVNGLFVNSGHLFGAASGPVAGELMAQLVAGEPPTLPLEAFAASRPALTASL